MRRSEPPSFWITNLSNMNVSLADLNVTIKAFSSINLLDRKHYDYTLEQIQLSVKSGSLFRKSNKIAVRKVPPTCLKDAMKVNRQAAIPSRERSTLVIKNETYEELNVSDEEFALESADLENSIGNNVK